MSRYVISHRIARLPESSRTIPRNAAEHTLASIKSGKVIREHTSRSGRRTILLEADPAEVRRVRRSLHEHVLLEDEIAFHHNAARLSSLTIYAESSDDKPLAGSQLFVLPIDRSRPPVTATAGSNGAGVLKFASDLPSFYAASYPAGGYWPVFATNPSGRVTLISPPVPMDGPLGWWHNVLGISKYDEKRGAGIRIGDVGMGVGPHPCVRHVISDGPDMGTHGTHVCGIIGARPRRAGQYAGIAPGADLFSLSAYDSHDHSNQAMVAETISRLIHDYQVDLINMSLGGPASKIVHEHVLEALDHGVLCIASAGNTFGAVEFPAAFREAISVSALGKTGWCPKDTAGSAWIPSRANRFGSRGLYLAAFSAFGSKIDCAGPGNAILSTVPERFGLKAPYASMEGTSMASAAVTGALAVALSKSREYLASPRVRGRAALARNILRDRYRDIGLSPRFQGKGVPSLR